MSRARAAIDQLDLVLSLLWLVPAALVTSGAVDIHPALRIVLAIPFVLALPGYAVVTAIFPALELPAVERLLLAIGASIIIVILCGLLIAATGELSPGRWALALAVVTATSLVAAWLRRLGKGLSGPRPRFATMPRLGALAVAIAVLLAANAVAVSRLSAAGNEPPAPLQLWLVSQESAANDALLGVRAGAQAADYRLVVYVGESPIHEFELSLEATETWQAVLHFSPEQRSQPIYARLFEAGSDLETRWVVLQPVGGQGSADPGG